VGVRRDGPVRRAGAADAGPLAGGSARLAARSPLERAQALLALAPPALPTTRRTAARLWPEAAGLLRLVAAAAIGRAPSALPVHRLLAEAWGLDQDGAERVRAALVLSADHELNASTFTVRCIASTGAALPATLLGGIAALSGPRHGGMTERVEALFDALERDGDAERLVAARLARGESVPGFGHPLYPTGDPRGGAPGARGTGRAHGRAGACGRRADRTVSDPRRRPRGARPAASPARGIRGGLFAIGRTAGWLAHGLEQIGQDRLIRPRARYTGPSPA
jgi:citrate synthase